MATCIDCGKEIPNTKPGNSICLDCVDKRAEALTPAQLIATAQVGLDAVIDEITGYQNIRTKGDLKKRYTKYLNKENRCTKA